MQTPDTISDESAVAAALRVAAARGQMALSIYAPARVSPETCRALIQDLLIFAHSKGWDQS